MSPESAILAERIAAVDMHLRRVADRLPRNAPANYGEAFRKLAAAHVIDAALSARLARAAGFRNVVAHAYETLDVERVHATAFQGPADLRAFLGALARQFVTAADP